MHLRVLRQQWANDLFNDVFALGAITRRNNRNHLLHHHMLARESDPDRRRC